MLEYPGVKHQQPQLPMPWWASHIVDFLSSAKKLLHFLLFLIVLYPFVVSSVFMMKDAGVIPSLAESNHNELLDLKSAMMTHIDEQRVALTKMTRTSLGTCFNAALQNPSDGGVAICMEDDEYLQKRMIEREMQNKGVKP